jgi:uncharacterized OB-fold protein
MGEAKRKVPFYEGMWTTKSDGEARLLGSKCPSCGELFFPRKNNGVCVHCQNEELEDVEFGTHGRIMTFTSVMRPPAGGYYYGPLPFNFGLIDLDDGVRIEAQIGADFEKLKVGMKVKLAIETLYMDEEGNEVQAYMFLPVKD